MSRFADKLQNVSRSSAAPIGFHPAVSEVRSPAMLLVVGLSGTQVKEAKVLAEVSADGGLIWSEDPSGKVVKQMVEGAGDVPLGVFVKSAGEEKINELLGAGCDFVVFDIKAAAAVLHKEKLGKFLMIEPSLDQGLARAINSLEVDGVLINSRGGDSFVTVDHLLICRRFVELLEKPVIMSLPSLATKGELTSLWQAGVDGVVAASTQSAQALAELKKLVGDLPRRTRGRRAVGGVVLPPYGGGGVGEEDEQEEQEGKIQP